MLTRQLKLSRHFATHSHVAYCALAAVSLTFHIQEYTLEDVRWIWIRILHNIKRHAKEHRNKSVGTLAPYAYGGDLRAD